MPSTPPASRRLPERLPEMTLSSSPLPKALNRIRWLLYCSGGGREPKSEVARCAGQGVNPMIRSAALLLSSFLLASCGKSENPAAPPLQNEIMVRSEAQQRLFDLSDLNRAI